MFEKTQNLFLFLALIFGFSFLALLPPFQAPDEMTHFLRAYQVAEGGWISARENGLSGGFLPTGLWQAYSEYAGLPGHPAAKAGASDLLWERLKRPLDRSARQFFHFPNTSTYTALVYLPQAFGIWIGNRLGASALALLYLGRVGNLLFWAALLHRAIRCSAFFGFVLLVSALLPMSLHQAASLSADAVVNGTCTLFIVLCLSQAVDPQRRLDRRNLAALALLSMAVALMKQAYLPLVLLLWLLPPEKFSGRRSRFSFLALVGLGALLASMAWGYAVSQVAVPMKADVEPLRQWQSVRSQPLAFLSFAARSFWDHLPAYLEQYLGQLGWLDVVLPRALLALLAATLLFTALADQNPNVMVQWRVKLFAAAVGLLCLLSLSLALWITWNPVGAWGIEGLQGRHFIPIALLGLLPIYNRQRWLGLTPRQLGPLCLVTVSVSLCWTLAVLFRRYYG